MNRKWHIRRAVLEDSAGLQGCMESAYASYEDRMGGDRLPPMDVDYRSEIEAFPTWVVDIEGEIAGGLIMAFEGDHASIANVAVHPTFQGRGVGGGLMRFAESEAKTRGYSDLRLATHVLLTENVALYLHLGWTEIERDGVRVFMKKTLEI